MADVIPLKLTAPGALRMIHQLAADSDRIVIIPHGRKRGRQRGITRAQMEACLRRGTIIEGPFVNDKGNWQVTMFRHAAGQELHCVVAIDWPQKLIIVTTY